MTIRAKLTKSFIDKIVAGPNDQYFWDSDLKGFGLRCTPSGKLTFIVQGRAKGAVNAMRITIGPFGVFTVNQARDVASEHLRSMRMGIDTRKVKAEAEAKAQAESEALKP